MGTMPNQPIPNVIVGRIEEEGRLRSVIFFSTFYDGRRGLRDQHARPCSSTEQRKYRGAHWQQKRLSAHRAESRSM